MSQYRVSLTNSANLAEKVTIEATPELVETRNVNYKTIDPVHAPGQIFAYQNSTARTFNMSSVKLVSRTKNEADRNLLYLWLLRAWTMPEFGRGGLTDSQRRHRETQTRRLQRDGISAAQQREILQDIRNDASWYGTNMRGTPPAVLLLSAYSPSNQDRTAMAHIHKVPVVIQNLSIPYPSDTDYIPSNVGGVPMPTIMTIDMTMAETHSPAEYQNFSLSEFKAGRLKDF